jgi:hypothetical protein
MQKFERYVNIEYMYGVFYSFIFQMKKIIINNCISMSAGKSDNYNY